MILRRKSSGKSAATGRGAAGGRTAGRGRSGRGRQSKATHVSFTSIFQCITFLLAIYVVHWNLVCFASLRG